jgi:hypothetical protein
MYRTERWEYLRFINGVVGGPWFDINFEPTSVWYTDLIDAGLEGWELVTMLPGNETHGNEYLFKRPLSEEAYIQIRNRLSNKRSLKKES